MPPSDATDLRNPGAGTLSDASLAVIQRGVWFIALKELGDSTQADDVAQDTVARLLDAVQRGARIDNAAAFARGIARHVIADMRAAHGRRESIDRIANAPAFARLPDPLAQTVSEEEAQQVRRALETLSPADRRLLHDLYVRDASAGDIAAATGEPPERIRKRKSRALERLRRAFFGHESRPGTTDRDGEPS